MRWPHLCKRRRARCCRVGTRRVGRCSVRCGGEGGRIASGGGRIVNSGGFALGSVCSGAFGGNSCGGGGLGGGLGSGGLGVCGGLGGGRRPSALRLDETRLGGRGGEADKVAAPTRRFELW